MSLKIMGIVGSLRKASFNRSLMNAFIENAPGDIELSIADISALPFYNEDIQDPYPASAATLKDTFAAADAFIIATPEYNRGVPGVLKNAIDWMSRPSGSPFAGKPVLVIGASDGNIGTAVAQMGLKHTLLHLDAHVLGKPEFYVGRAQDKFNEEGKLTDQKTKEYIIAALEKLISACKA